MLVVRFVVAALLIAQVAVTAPLCPVGSPSCCSGDADCDDGDACSGTETCDVPSGTCVGGVPVTCMAPDDCHLAGTCDPTTGLCSNPPAPDTTPCDDGDGCTVADHCLGGACQGVPRSCDDGLACTDDTCTAGQCRHQPVDARCATGDVCLPAACDPAAPGASSAGCVTFPDQAAGITCTEDGDPCTDDTCVTGACAHTPVAGKTTCDPVRDAYERTLVLLASTQRLSERVGAAFPSGGGGTLAGRLTDIAATFQDVVSILSGREGASGGSEGVALLRAQTASPRVRDTPADLAEFLGEIGRLHLPPETARDFRRRARDLLRGTKALKRELKRLQAVSRSFTR